MTPAQLDVAIRATILTEGVRSVQVISRRSDLPARNKLEAGFGGFTVGLLMVRTMNWKERLSWIAWSWGLCFVSLRGARRNRNRLRALKRAHMKKRLAPRLIDAAA
jgi:hypothetical protein